MQRGESAIKNSTVSATALAVVLALGAPLANASDVKDPFPATATSEAHMKAKNAYQNALTDCEMLDNPDRRQLCTDNVRENYDLMIEEADETAEKGANKKD